MQLVQIIVKYFHDNKVLWFKKDINDDLVYRIDIDLPFSENCLVVLGTLEDYFNNFVSAYEYQIAMEKFVEKLRGE